MQMPRPTSPVVIAAHCGVAALLAACSSWLFSGLLCAQTPLSTDRAPVLLDNMDSPAPALKLLDPGSGIRIVGQSIEQGCGNFGDASERVVLEIPAGSSAHLGYDVPQIPAVIPEVRFAAWISCNRPGAQLAATVVLPHSRDPKTGLPRRLLIRAGEMAASGDWQLIALDNLPDHLADHARVARAKYGGDIDEREAYVSQLVILAPGGPGMTELTVDQITVHGVFTATGKEPAQLAAGRMTPEVTPAAATFPIAPAAKRPPVPRIIQWQGEPLEMLQKIGFDAVWMGRLPIQPELAEAARLGMFIVCPPPLPQQLTAGSLGPEFAMVLAWDLGSLAETADVDLTSRWAQAIEHAETNSERPVVLQPFGMAREASRIADVVLIGRAKLGSTQTWSDYAASLSQQRRLARPGTPVWINVETHCGPRFMAQLAVLRGGGAAIVPATFNDLSRATTAAFSVAPRGFTFQSHTSLAGGEVENQLRALALELTNLRLGLAEPWLAAGKMATAARSTRPEITAMVLKVERSHLIIPLQWSDSHSPAPGDDSQPQSLAFDLPGVPESCDSYLVSVSGSQRLQARRVTGGLRISIDHLPDDAFVLVTEDGYAFSHVERYLREHAPRAAQARVELAVLRRQQAAQAISKLPPEAVTASGVGEVLAAVDAQMTAVTGTLGRRDFAAAFACAAEAERLLDFSQERIAAAVAPGLPPGTSPIPAHWSTIADLALVEQAVRQTEPSLQLVPGGEFESLEELLNTGWQRVQTSPAGVQTAVRLSPEAPARGNHCLELEVRSANSQSATPSLPTPPVWVTSPPIAVPDGHLVEITGVARVGDTPLGSPDPLLIFDSIGGEESAIRVTSAPSWTLFRLIRAAPPGGELRVTIALGGIGRAQVDWLAFRFVPMRTDAVAQAALQTR